MPVSSCTTLASDNIQYAHYSCKFGKLDMCRLWRHRTQTLAGHVGQRQNTYMHVIDTSYTSTACRPEASSRRRRGFPDCIRRAFMHADVLPFGKTPHCDNPGDVAYREVKPGNCIRCATASQRWRAGLMSNIELRATIAMEFASEEPPGPLDSGTSEHESVACRRCE